MDNKTKEGVTRSPYFRTKNPTYYIGKTFGTRTVLSYEGKNQYGKFLYKAKCTCGGETIGYIRQFAETNGCQICRKVFSKRRKAYIANSHHTLTYKELSKEYYNLKSHVLTLINLAESFKKGEIVFHLFVEKLSNIIEKLKNNDTDKTA